MPACNASNVRGYNLHAQTRVSAHDEAARLRLFRYILRPAIAQDRLHFENGLVTFTMKRVFSDGSQVLRFTPQAFIRRMPCSCPRRVSTRSLTSACSPPMPNIEATSCALRPTDECLEFAAMKTSLAKHPQNRLHRAAP